MATMGTVTWISALVAVAVVLGTGAYMARGALDFWRTFRRFSRVAGAAAERVTLAASVAETRANAAGAGAERLSAAAARLRRSRAQLAVLQSAAGELTVALARLRRLVPTK
jgi:hypothetical protein